MPRNSTNKRRTRDEDDEMDVDSTSVHDDEEMNETMENNNQRLSFISPNQPDNSKNAMIDDMDSIPKHSLASVISKALRSQPVLNSCQSNILLPTAKSLNSLLVNQTINRGGAVGSEDHRQTTLHTSSPHFNSLNPSYLDRIKQKVCSSVSTIDSFSSLSLSPQSPRDPASLERMYGCCGNNVVGQLGCGDRRKKTHIVRQEARSTITHIGCGTSFVLMVTSMNEILGCGDNWYGQLGIGYPTKKHVTTLTRATWDCKLQVKQISCGFYHSLILTIDGKVYACGANRAGALGLGDFTNRNMFQRVNIIFFDDEIEQIVCGGHYSAIISKRGRLFVSGVNIEGELGVADYTNRNLFTYVSQAPEIGLIAFRPGFSVVYAKFTQEVYITGRTIGNLYRKAFGFPTDIKQIKFVGHNTIVLCNNGDLFLCCDENVEFNFQNNVQFNFQRVNLPPILDVQCGLDFVVAVGADSTFYALGDKGPIFACLEENPSGERLEEFKPLLHIPGSHFNAVACGGAFNYFYQKTTKVIKRTTLQERLQPFDPYQDISITFVDFKRKPSAISLSSIVQEFTQTLKKRKV